MSTPSAASYLALALLVGTAGCSDDPDRTPDDGAGAATSSPTDYARGLCVDAINDYRATVGRAPLARWFEAEPCADNQAYSDSQTGQPHGAFGDCGEWAQNECPGWPGPPGEMIEGCLAAMWSEGPGGGHYENMANSSYTMVVCGFYETESGSVWALQDFR